MEGTMRQSASVLFFATIAASAQGPIQSSAPQGQPPSSGPPPSFHIGTKLVEVEVVAKDKYKDRNGLAAGLTKPDFTLLDNGKPQEIAVFSVKAAPKSAQTPTKAVVALPPGIVSNRVNRQGEPPGSVTLVLLDQKNTTEPFQVVAIHEIVKFIAERRKQDRIGIYVLERFGLRLVQDITDDDGLLRAAAKSLKPLAPRTNPDTVVQFIERATDTKHAFQAVARHLASEPGRKSAVWITNSFPLVLPALGLDFTEDMQAAAQALGDSNIALYAVSARSLSPAGRGIYPPGFNTMDLMAELTGGQVFINTNDIAGAIETAAEDDDLVYTLGFYPAQDEPEALPHKLKVEVARKGLTLLYRESYVAAKTQAPVDPKAVQELLKDSLDATEIELAARAIPDTAHPGSYRVQVSVNLHDVQFQHHDGSPKDALWTGQLGVALTVEGSEDIREITRKLEFRDDQLKAGIDRGTLVETSIPTPPGSKGILRIAVQDQLTGAAGSVKVPFGGK
jgi:VWFA-related protein